MVHDHRDEEKVRNEYRRLAPVYDHRWARYIRASVEGTLARLALRPGARVLDVGCGTGALLEAMAGAQPSARLTGVDLSEAMLDRAHARLGRRVGLVLGSAGRLPFTSGRFDVVVSCSSFHYWSDPAAGLDEIARVLAPGGVLVVTDWCDDFIACRVCDVVLRLYNPAHRRAYGGSECLRLLEAAGFPGAVVDRYRIGWLWGLMTVRAGAG